jgi:hypothetical protein
LKGNRQGEKKKKTSKKAREKNTIEEKHQSRSLSAVDDC